MIKKQITITMDFEVPEDFQMGWLDDMVSEMFDTAGNNFREYEIENPEIDYTIEDVE